VGDAIDTSGRRDAWPTQRSGSSITVNTGSRGERMSEHKDYGNSSSDGLAQDQHYLVGIVGLAVVVAILLLAGRAVFLYLF